MRSIKVRIAAALLVALSLAGCTHEQFEELNRRSDAYAAQHLSEPVDDYFMWNAFQTGRSFGRNRSHMVCTNFGGGLTDCQFQ